ncbi:MAG TPA: TetR/AcrR family transcriptional regulator [Anaerolineales bacterium]|nr:TetR/AcrR family transcriptional regulator [Anaerolineales bacterium]
MYTKSEATITKIITAAQALFVNKNYADVAMDDIAESAGVTKGALYHHFENKEALYVAMMLGDLTEKQALFHTAVASVGTCRERLRRFTQDFLDLPRGKRDLIKLIRRDINIFNDPIREQLIRAYQAALPEQVELIIRDGIRDGELLNSDPRLLSWLHVAMVEVVLTRYAESVFNSQAEAVEFVTTQFFSGAGAIRIS